MILRGYEIKPFSFVYEVAISGGALGDNELDIPVANGFTGIYWTIRVLETFTSAGGLDMLSFGDGTDILTRQVQPGSISVVEPIEPINFSSGGSLTANVVGEPILTGKGIVCGFWYLATEE